jgi:hypothetical protein
MLTKKDFSEWDAAINYDPINNTIKPTSLFKYSLKIAFGKLHRLLTIIIIIIIVWLYLVYEYVT